MDQHTITSPYGDNHGTSTEQWLRVQMPCFGRDPDIHACQTFLANAPLVTITGPGGVGKSTVLRAVMQSLADIAAPQVQWICWSFDLARLAAPIPSPFSLPCLLEHLQCCGAASLTLRDLAIPHTVLALDNCDEQMDAIVWFIDYCLRYFPDLHILVSSRAICHLRCEVIWRLRPLPAPSRRDVGDWEHALSNPAVQLLVARLQAAQPCYYPHQGDSAALVSLCQSLEGLPLAIELAAEQQLLRSVEQLADELLHHPDAMLTWRSQRHDIPHHHQTLEASLTYSLERLTRAERELLEHLAVFTGGWELDAMYHVCNDLPYDAAACDHLLHRLINYSLVCVTSAANAADPSWAPGGLASTVTRHYLLASTRQAIWQRMSASTRAALQRKMLIYYVNLAETFEGHLRSSEQRCWLARLHREQQNLMNTLQVAQQLHEPVFALRLASSLWLYWILTMQLREGRSYIEHLLQTDAELSLSLRATALYRLGMIAFFQGDVAHVESCALESLTLFRQTADQQGAVLALSLLLHVALRQNNVVLARELGNVCQAWLHALPDMWHAAFIQITLIIIFARQHRFDEAWQLGVKVVQTWRLLGDRWGEAYTLDALGQIASVQGEYSESTDYFRRSLHIFQTLDHEEGVARALLHLGLDLIEQEAFLEARAVLEASMTLCQRFCRQIGVARAALGLARIHIHLAAYNTAAAYVADALEHFQQHGDLRDFRSALTLFEELSTRHPSRYLRASMQRFRADWARVESRGIVVKGEGPSSPSVSSLFEIAAVLNDTTMSSKNDVFAEHVARRNVGWRTVIDISSQVIATKPLGQSTPFALAQRSSAALAYLEHSDHLTPREQEILRLLDAGKSNEMIAADLVISRGTVRTHLSAIYRKLQVNSRTAALHAARSHHLLA